EGRRAGGLRAGVRREHAPAPGGAARDGAGRCRNTRHALTRYPMTSVHSATLTSALDQTGSEPAVQGEFRRQARRAAAALLAAGALALGWSAMAPLSGAVIAPAEVKVELNRKTVQHAEGGIVREILVRD